MQRARRYAAVEGGGTTWVVAISEGEPQNIVLKSEFATEANPEITLGKVRNWLNQQFNQSPFDAIGVATFGPIEAKINAPKFGFITSTPKPGWKDTNVLKLIGLKDEFKNVPFLFDTDVNAPALAEYSFLNNPHLSSSAYITVGTGVGVGLVINGKTVHGMMHPEAGHLLVQKLPHDQSFSGSCPFHGCCIEGMCSTGALSRRANIPASDLPQLADDHELWDICAHYIAQLCAALVLISSVEHISIGGGVLNRTILYPKIRTHLLKILNEYIENESLTIANIDTFIAVPVWGANAGLVGAAYLAHVAYQSS
jgi:fructokinase